MRFLLLLVLFPSQMLAQQFARDLQAKLDAHYQSFVPLKVHVLTSQPEYAAGDTIFFSVHLVTAQGHYPVSGRSILSAALLDDKDQKMLAIRLSVSNGAGSNQIILPATFSAGQYYLSVWTDGMTNNKTLLYRKPVRVGMPVPANKPLLARPEGGKLIDGLNCRIVVMGMPHSSGYLNDNGSKSVAFFTSSNGTASFYLTPKTGHRYEIVCDDNSVILPEVMSDGIGILIAPMAQKQSIRVYLTAPETSAYRQKIAHLVLSMQGVIYHSNEIAFKNQSFVSAEIPLRQLPDGIAQVTVFDDEYNVIAERLIYNSATERATATVTLPRKQFQVREKIQLEVDLRQGIVPKSGTLAATVFHNEFTPADTTASYSLQTDLELYADAGYTDLTFTTNETTSAIYDKLVLAEWNRFDWRNLTARPDGAYQTQYLVYTGRAFDIQTNRPLPDSSRITFFLQNDVSTYQAYTNSTGEFTVAMLVEFYGSDEMFYRVEHGGELLQNARLAIDDDLAVHAEEYQPQRNKTGYQEFFDKRTVVSESYAYHLKADRCFAPEIPHAIVEDEIFGPDVTINMNDYHLFPTMIETLREIIPVAQHRVIRGKDVVRMFNDETKSYFDAEPVYFIDGVMTDDIDYFLSLNPAEIETIKLVYSPDKLRMFSAIGKGGIFIIETKIPGNHKNVQRSVRSIALKGLNKPIRRNVVAQSRQANSRVPDLRTNLLWLPNFEMNAEGHASIGFYASDVPGKYRIEGEGITADGRIFTFEEEFDVIFEK